jgi:plasmanylethanolamine desaturase
VHVAPSTPSAGLPAHFALTSAQTLLSALSIAAAAAAVVALGVRILLDGDVWHWWVPIAFVSGIVAADLGSGLVHWGADTWGRDDLPLIGHRLLVPFRIHHINPDDFLRRRFIDTNGEVAMIACPVVLGLLALPLTAPWQMALAVFGLAFCGVGMMTNQIHQWAHRPEPPRAVRWLQDAHLLLGRGSHAEHHRRPYDVQYCITTGWCNRPLEGLDAFRRLEWAVTLLTGAQPRRDDRRYEDRYGIADGS